MTICTSLLLGLSFAFAGWQMPRIIARTCWNWSLLLLLDGAMPLMLFCLVATLGARPVFAGFITFAIGSAYAYADRSKKIVLAEPIVFTDVFQAFDIFRHPGLALPFPHKGRIAAGVAAGLTLLVILFRAEAPAWSWSLWPPLTVVALIMITGWTLSGPLNRIAGRYLRRFPFSEDPCCDAVTMGPFATLLAYGILARAERSGRQDKACAAPVIASRAKIQTSAKTPVVVIQCESFFDARRLHPDLAHLRLPTLDQCRTTSSQWGHLSVPSWGANTVRTEFAVLTGLEQQALGLDRFNPYNRFANRPISSLAWQLREQGYRTICLHPFDRSFYGRDRVLPNLGFETFIGEEAFVGAPRVNGYISDIECARVACEILSEEKNPVFLFVITMENHGPWPQAVAASNSLLPASLDVPLSERDALEHYLQSIGSADLMLKKITNYLEPGGLLAFYGDHLPSFPASFKHLGLQDTRSDYLIWRGGQAGLNNKPPAIDIHAHDLGAAILQAQQSSVMSSGRRPD
ncbi:MAG: LTA synthase family protein [Stenotrophobium sp.]